MITISVEQIFSKVNKTFFQRQQVNNLLVTETGENESQLLYLESELRTQSEINAKQSASLSITSNNMERAAKDLLDYVNVDYIALTESIDSLHEDAEQSFINLFILKCFCADFLFPANGIITLMVTELQCLRSLERRLCAEINEISVDICNARTKLLSDQHLHSELNEKFSTLSAELEVLL